MRTLVFMVFVSSAAFAEPPRATTMAKTTSYRRCVKNNICGAGENGGFASQGWTTQCEGYTFRPNGTYAGTGEHASSGRYRVIGRTVTLTPVVEKKALPPFELRLSVDRQRLGDLNLVDSAAMRAKR